MLSNPINGFSDCKTVIAIFEIQNQFMTDFLSIGNESEGKESHIKRHKLINERGLLKERPFNLHNKAKLGRF